MSSSGSGSSPSTVERVILEFVQQPEWSSDATAPEDSAEWRAGYEAAQSNLREELKPWWPHAGFLDLSAALTPSSTALQEPTEAMIEAGTCEAADWLPRYAEMATSDLPGLCRAIYLAMQAAAPKPALQERVEMLEGALGEARKHIRVGGVSYDTMMRQRRRIDAALKDNQP